MSSMSRLLLGLVAVAALLVSFALPAEWLSESGLGEQFSIIAREQQRQADLNRNLDDARERLRTREMVLRQLLKGELTLFEAAAWFRTLNAVADFPIDLSCYGGASEGERLCRQVLTWVRNQVQVLYPPSQADDILGRLEADLDDHLQRHGTVILPEE